MNRAVTITEQNSGEDAEQLMKDENTDFLNVIDGTGGLLGIITKSDLYKLESNVQ